MTKRTYVKPTTNIVELEPAETVMTWGGGPGGGNGGYKDSNCASTYAADCSFVRDTGFTWSGHKVGVYVSAGKYSSYGEHYHYSDC